MAGQQRPRPLFFRPSFSEPLMLTTTVMQTNKLVLRFRRRVTVATMSPKHQGWMIPFRSLQSSNLHFIRLRFQDLDNIRNLSYPVHRLRWSQASRTIQIKVLAWRVLRDRLRNNRAALAAQSEL